MVLDTRTLELGKEGVRAAVPTDFKKAAFEADSLENIAASVGRGEGDGWMYQCMPKTKVTRNGPRDRNPTTSIG